MGEHVETKLVLAEVSDYPLLAKRDFHNVAEAWRGILSLVNAKREAGYDEALLNVARQFTDHLRDSGVKDISLVLPDP
jgi:hypothetical protein